MFRMRSVAAGTTSLTSTPMHNSIQPLIPLHMKICLINAHIMYRTNNSEQRWLAETLAFHRCGRDAAKTNKLKPDKI